MRTLKIYNNKKDPRFKYLVKITKGGKKVVTLKSTAKWPMAQNNLFCIRTDDKTHKSNLVEETPITVYKKTNNRIMIVLDRRSNKRCQFLYIKRKYKDKNEFYEQIFWQTQQSLKQAKLKSTIQVRAPKDLLIYKDSNEKWGWTFGDTIKVEKEKLRLGDYAIKKDGKILAVVERKTINDFLSGINNLSAFHHTLADLENIPHSALVIEGNLSRILDSKKKYMAPAFVLKCVTEISAMHPKLKIMFLDSKKLATLWTKTYFIQVLKITKENLKN